ncbi:MAG: hypothetical protein J4428_04100 [Candidatus Aenigmarchaeota archaeon]|nr:hypothetical protein [Candidatus Aenigmarchaeota archaeon]
MTDANDDAIYLKVINLCVGNNGSDAYNQKDPDGKGTWFCPYTQRLCQHQVDLKLRRYGCGLKTNEETAPDKH